MKAVVATFLIIITLVKISNGGWPIEIKGELAHCGYKSKLKTERSMIFSPKIVCNSIIIGYICGDKCLKYDKNYISTCQCGDDKFNHNEQFYYCCTPPDVTCEHQGKYDVNCTMGKKLLFNEICYEQQRCPTAWSSELAVTTNCSNQTRNNCPASHSHSSKICTNSVNITSIGGIENACQFKGVCPEAKNGPVYQQCYSK